MEAAHHQVLTGPNYTHDRKIRRQALKYIMCSGELYQSTMEGLLLKCLNNEQACVAMGEVHEGLCRTY
jgi:hypothetical protein